MAENDLKGLGRFNSSWCNMGKIFMCRADHCVFSILNLSNPAQYLEPFLIEAKSYRWKERCLLKTPKLNNKYFENCYTD